ncbi:hypothetical protein BGZ76_007637 [Entomortierella beljakovae]|nr:hypothetical protein BGZ76_007637 [Entomortierella beljakovae]
MNYQPTKFRFCADGGANRLYDLLKTDEEREKYLPDCIRGDFDSLREPVRNYYASKGVPIEKLESQDSTDFMKCIDLVRDHDKVSNSSNQQDQPSTSNLGVVALGGTGGRFDQSMSLIHHLYILNRERQATLVSDDSIVVILGPGKHEITCSLEIEGPTCGIIPVGISKAVLTTSGLKWDVENWETSFGTQLSTSNALVESKVVIETDAPVVWTTELRSK